MIRDASVCSHFILHDAVAALYISAIVVWSHLTKDGPDALMPSLWAAPHPSHSQSCGEPVVWGAISSPIGVVLDGVV